MELELLLVDDDELIRKFLELVLKMKYPHLKLALAGNGIEAIEILENQCKEGSNFIIVSDNKMPMLDGVSLFKIVEKRFPSACFVLMTGTGKPRDYNGNYFRKPLDVNSLFSFIDSISA
jgi:YesN/AraC family two-component response regulator